MYVCMYVCIYMRVPGECQVNVEMYVCMRACPQCVCVCTYAVNVCVYIHCTNAMHPHTVGILVIGSTDTATVLTYAYTLTHIYFAGVLVTVKFTWRCMYVCRYVCMYACMYACMRACSHHCECVCA